MIMLDQQTDIRNVYKQHCRHHHLFGRRLHLDIIILNVCPYVYVSNEEEFVSIVFPLHLLLLLQCDSLAVHVYLIVTLLMNFN